VEEGFIPEARAQPFVHDASPSALLDSLLKATQPLTPATPVLGPAQR
jgi:hypothetical protein